MTMHAYTRIESGIPMPGVFEIGQEIPIRNVIDDLLLIATCSLNDEYEGQVRYLPLR